MLQRTMRRGQWTRRHLLFADSLKFDRVNERCGRLRQIMNIIFTAVSAVVKLRYWNFKLVNARTMWSHMESD